MAEQNDVNTIQVECGECAATVDAAEPGEDGWYAVPDPDRPRELIWRFTVKCPDCGEATTVDRSEP